MATKASSGYLKGRPKKKKRKLFLFSEGLLGFFLLAQVLGYPLNMKKHTWKITQFCTVKPLVTYGKIRTVA